MNTVSMINRLAGLFKDSIEAKELIQKHVHVYKPGTTHECPIVVCSDGDARFLNFLVMLMEEACEKKGKPLEMFTLYCELEPRGISLFGGSSRPDDLGSIENKKDPGAKGVYYSIHR
jgi:hypothetical protein